MTLNNLYFNPKITTQVHKKTTSIQFIKKKINNYFYYCRANGLILMTQKNKGVYVCVYEYDTVFLINLKKKWF